LIKRRSAGSAPPANVLATPQEFRPENALLKTYACNHTRFFETPPEAANAVWYDLMNPSDAEIAAVQKETGLSLPSQADVSEIENSSRLSSDGPVLTMSMPIVTRTDEGLLASACGFVLSPDRLVTLRFAPSLAVDHFKETPHETGEAGGASSAFIFAGLLETFVDKQADALERLRNELDAMSHQVFHHRFALENNKADKRRNQESELQSILVTLGRAYDTISFLRDSQLGIARIAPYTQTTADWLPKSVTARLKSLTKDITSLNEFSTHLTDKVQFLLDATLGLISISQNSLIKVLTIVSIVGIPPTLIAGIYGMNFHDMPELNWAYGYPYAWALMILSAVLPLILFRLKGWL
jgi:magnesium transporter